MKIARYFSTEGKPVVEQVKWKTIPEVKVEDGLTKEIIFSAKNVEVPKHWSDNAAGILANKYFRKAGVPDAVVFIPEKGVPDWLCRCRSNDFKGGPEVNYGSETSAKQVFHRMAGCWAYWGWKEGLLTTEEDALAFYDELFMMLALQKAAPNSPQWFNTGLHWAYGLDGPASGQWSIDWNGWGKRKLSVNTGDEKLGESDTLYETQNSYERPQPHACFIQSIKDDLVNPGGIMDLYSREVRLFKYGSGTGTNFSTLRAKGESLSGGGVSSGLMSFLPIGDRAAGSIASGGTTRRSAKMVIVDADHPEICEFIDWKVWEEYKAACMYIGSKAVFAQSMMRQCGYEIPTALKDRLSVGYPAQILDVDWEGIALGSVSGQNSNNSVRVNGEFMDLTLYDNANWNLIARTTGKTVGTIKAQELWQKICTAAWACADPGLLFADTINSWNTCSNDGEIRASNPCGEYQFLDDTACNLASLNLVGFLRPDGSLDLDGLIHAVRLWTMVLEISVHMASFPSKEIAIGSYNYRTLGLGYANLGGLFMRMALPYDSDEGRTLAAAITALIHFQAYKTSNEMASEVGPFPRWKANAHPMAEVLNKHIKALYDVVGNSQVEQIVHAAITAANSINYGVGFRNAQVTNIAPTGTISFVMDCDTTGMEPDFALVKHKKLAGGGTMTIANQGIEPALLKLGYDIMAARRAANSIVAGGSLTIAGIKPEHQSIFHCANEINPMAHVDMLAAVQPFLSGAASKTINMPRNATVKDVSKVYRHAWKSGVKAISLYRDGSKLTQPLSSAEIKAEVEHELEISEEERKQAEEFFKDVPPNVYIAVKSNGHDETHTAPQREMLPWRRTNGFTQKVKIGEKSIFLRVSEYPDGRPGEIFLDLDGEGSTLRAMANHLAIAISVGLQHGIPAGEYVKHLLHSRFEPSGYVEGHDQIKLVNSIADYIGKELAISYCGRDDLVQGVKPNEPFITAAESVQAGELGLFEIHATKSTPVGDLCPGCHNASLRRTGTCVSCEICQYNTGCG
jgi:ribonucleoside-diphosphate reductase alpha chain